MKEKVDKKQVEYSNFIRELKMLRDMKVTVIRIVVGALGTSLQSLKKRRDKLEIRGKSETIQTTAHQKPARILITVQET